jgi:ketosteroid isomerase-like protein
MTVIAEVVLRGLSREEYDAVRAECRWLEEPPDGGIAHLTWWDGEDCHTVDGRESEPAFRTFDDHRLGPALTALGLDGRREVGVHAAHEISTPRRAVVVEPPAPEVADPVARTRSAYEAFALGDIPAVLDLLAPDIVWSTPDSVRFGGRYTGRAGVLEFFSLVREHMGELHVEPETYLDPGDAVAVLGRHRGRWKRGEAREVPWAHLWTWRDGRATGLTEHFDPARVASALPEGRDRR